MLENEDENGGDDFEPTMAERGELMEAIKRYALDGFLIAGVGNREEFEKMWREAFAADQI